MKDDGENSVSRWSKAVDSDRIRQEEAQRKKRTMLLTSGIVVILLIFVGAICYALGGQHRRKSAAAAKPAPQCKQVAAARCKAVPPLPPLPTDPAEIRKLESNPTNPVIKISTSKGDMLCELFEDKVPNTVANMVELAEKGFYKGMSFHRIIPDFMAQGGCPFSKQGAHGTPGTGDPGYRFADEFNPDLKHDGRGILSMANSGPDTNGSQFFICFEAAPHLNGKHSVFGKVIAGKKVLDALEKVGTPSGKPRETVRFNIEVVLKQDHPYTVKKL